MLTACEYANNIVFPLISHTTWDCKYHVIWIPKYWKKLIYGQLRKYLGEVFRELSMQREWGSGRSPHARPCSYAGFNSTKIFGLSGSGFCPGQECHSHRKDVFGIQEELYRPELLGQGLFCGNGRQRRKSRAGIYEATANRGPTVGSIEYVQMTATFRWLTFLTALSGSHLQAFGFAGDKANQTGT
jgi:putative transposase